MPNHRRAVQCRIVWQIDRILDHGNPNKVYGSQQVFKKRSGRLGRELTSMRRKEKVEWADEILYLCGGASCSSGLVLAYVNSGGASGRVLEAPGRKPLLTRAACGVRGFLFIATVNCD